MTRSALEKTIQRSFDGTLGEGECRELREALKSDPAARALYYDYAGLHQALLYRLSRTTGIGAGKDLARARLRQQTRRSARLAMTAAAAVLIGLGVVLRLIFVPDAPPMATLQSADGSLFTMEHSDAESEAGPDELGEGTTVHLTQGSLELELRNGSRAVVLAPATFHFQSEKRMFLRHGTAWFRVARKDHGFQVATPEMVVTDLGTEFGVISGPDLGDEVHVFSGMVRTRSLNALRKEETLLAGQARSCDPVGKLTTIRVRPEGFLTSLPADRDTGLIANGDFEAGTSPADRRYGVYATPALLPSWRFGREVRVVRASSSGHPGYGEEQITILSSTGDVQVGIADDTPGRPAPEDVSLRQTFATEPGTRYEVEFEMGAIFFNRYAMVITAAVHDGTAAGSVLGQLVESRAPAAGNGYNSPVRFVFTATSSSATLVFTETSENTQSADPVIDNVTVTPLP